MSDLKTTAWNVLARAGREARMLAVFLVIAAACLVAKGRGSEAQRYEWFPFSHFPMYSDFADRDYYVYVADSQARALGTETLTDFRSTKLKKIFNTRLSKIQKEHGKRKHQLTAEQCAPAGIHTLQWLYENSSPAARKVLRAGAPLGIYRVYISVEDGKVVETEPEAVGRWSPAMP